MKNTVLSFLMATIWLTHSFVFLLAAPDCATAQSGQISDKTTDKIKNRIRELGVREDVTIVLKGGKNYHGAISKIETDSIEISEIDLKQVVSINYTEIKKVYKGYTEKRFLVGNRPKPHNPWIGRAILGGLLAAILIAVATAKD